MRTVSHNFAVVYSFTKGELINILKQSEGSNLS